MKTLALFLSATVFILAGQLVNKRIKKRVSSLEEMIVFIEGINSQIIFSRNNIETIINDLSYACEIKLKTICELSKSTDPDFFEKWRSSVEKFYREDCLKSEDKKILISFGKGLGVTDLQGQSSNCRVHLSMLEKQLIKAQRDVEEKLKTNSALSLFAALAVIIILY